MHCQRCSKEFPDAELKPPSRILRLLALPFFAICALSPGALSHELMAHYCRPCRRQLNFCIFFAAFMVVAICTYALLLQLGIVVPLPPQPPQ